MMATSSLARRSLVAVALLAWITTATDASSPKFFQSATQADFLKGEVESLSIDGRGQLVLGPATELVYETPSPFLWTVVAGADNALFIGTGNDGRVFRVDAQDQGAPFFDAAELEVHAVAPAPNGGLYVATSPDGRIYKVDRSGNAGTFFDPDDKYIWALATDARGNVYAGTGDKGIVYKISPDGRGEPFYRSKATHAMSLAVDSSGQLFVGTESPGRVLRVDADGKAFLLLDTPFTEIRRLRFDEKGTLYVAAVSGRPGGTAVSGGTDASPPGTSDPTRAPVPSVTVTTEITSVGGVDTGAPRASGGARDEGRGGRGAVYRIAPDGLWDELWTSREDSPYDLAFDADGQLVIGTGSKGKIYRLEGNPLQPMLLARADAQQVTALHRDARGRLYYATANPGKLFRLSQTRAPRGSYESQVHDTEMVSSWGSVSWRGSVPGGARIEISTRSGNTETPDDAWSAWSAPYARPEGSPITSPKARYLQWRAVLSGSGDGPVLTSVTAAYLQRNLRPHVRSITVHPPGIVFQKPYGTGDPDLAGFENQSTPDRRLAQSAQNAQPGSSSPSLGRRTYQKGLQTLIWRADDENGDELAFDVLYRREGGAGWTTLRRDVTESILVWDTATVPNGTYFVKIAASDHPSNAAGTALTGELESAAFEIDNTPPAIAVTSVRVEAGRTIVVFDVKDDHSAVQRVECSQDGQRWRGVFPADGIADSKSERYEVTLDGLLGSRGLTVRAADAMNNLVTAQVDAPRNR
jgi:sugar lactone lactonase YvrE